MTIKKVTVMLRIRHGHYHAYVVDVNAEGVTKGRNMLADIKAKHLSTAQEEVRNILRGKVEEIGWSEE